MTQHPAWLEDANIRQLFAAAKNAGGELRAVGGAVRDWKMGVAGADVDFATTLLPEQVMALAKAQSWKAVPTGIDHGTVTVVFDGRGHEITTLRRDIATDGRHAQVAYTHNWGEDAGRRDFTVNALYMDASGAIHDPTGQGEADLAAHRLCFIGDADKRIEEDALRILRYFRFLAMLGWNTDQAAIDACATHRTMIANLSGERIAQEMKKLLAAPSPVAALAAMANIGLAEFLTESPWNTTMLGPLLSYEKEYGLPADPWVRLLALIAAPFRVETASWVDERWKLSRAERGALAAMAHHDRFVDPAVVKKWLRAYPRPRVIGRLLLAALDSDEALAIAQLLRLAQEWEIPTFSVTAGDLMKKGMQEGPALGDALRELEQRWIDSDYTLTREQLLATSR